MRGPLNRYLLALGSNRRHVRYGAPEKVLAAALRALEQADVQVTSAAPVLRSEAIGPSLRRYANSAALVETRLPPLELLACLKRIEAQFGRRVRGQRWTARVLDLDIVLWSGGAFAAQSLTIPHPLFRERPFVLSPARTIAPNWRDPVTRLAVRHLHARLTRRRPLRRSLPISHGAGP